MHDRRIDEPLEPAGTCRFPRRLEIRYLDDQYAELIATVWACERSARHEDRIDAVIWYGVNR
jgi:hypothetical protein